MGRGHRGGSGGGRGGRLGRRTPGGGGGTGRHAGRPGQPAPVAPTGEALVVELRASPGFFKAVEESACPAKSLEADSGPTPLGTTQLQLADWKDLGALVAWFRDGIDADPQAELAFSPRLTKALRASVHGTATAVGLGGLGTASRGLGEERRVVVMARARAERAQPALDEKQDHKAYWVYRWAQQQSLQVSRDEVAEMVLNDALTPQLQSLWDTGAAQQKAVQRLCGAAASGDLAGIQEALAARPDLLRERVFDVESGVAPLHVAAREGQVEALELLLSEGADLEGKDGHGWTALRVARKFDQSDAEGVLLRAGARDPDKGKSLIDKPLPDYKPAKAAASPAADPHAAAHSQGAQQAQEAPSPGAAAGAPPLSSEVAQDGDSAASVCGTEYDTRGMEVSSNADDYADSQYHAGSTAIDAVEEGQEEAVDAASPSAEALADGVAPAGSSQAARKLPVPQEQLEGQAGAASKAGPGLGEALVADGAEREAAAQQPRGPAAKAIAAAETQGVERAGEERDGPEREDPEREDGDSEDEDGEEDESIEEEVAEAAGTATVVAIRAFETALAAAEAAEAAAEEAEGLGGTEGAARAAAFRKESEAAMQAAAAAAVAAGDELDRMLTPAHSASAALSSPPVELASVASVVGSEPPHAPSLDLADFEPAASSALSASSQSAQGQTAPPSMPSMTASLEGAPAAEATGASVSQGAQGLGELVAAQLERQQQQEDGQSQEQKTSAHDQRASATGENSSQTVSSAASTAAPQASSEAVERAGEALLAGGTAAAAAGCPVVGVNGTEAAARKLPEGQPVQEAAVGAAADVEAQAADLAKSTGAAAQTTWQAVRAELEELLPGWTTWVQEHPGSVMVGAGLAAAALTGLLFFTRRR